MDLKTVIRDFPDFPKEGILFRDITSLLADPAAFNAAIVQIEALLEGIEYDIIIGPESRGFIFGTPIALRQGKSFVPARKKGKLPGEVFSKTYALEYGEDCIQIHKADVPRGSKVVIIDDLLATGGTASIICDIVEEMGATVEAAVFLIELEGLNGRAALDAPVKSVLTY